MLDALDRNSKSKKGETRRAHRFVTGASSLERCAATTAEEERRAAEEEPLGRTATAAAGRLVTETVRSIALEIGRERRRRGILSWGERTSEEENKLERKQKGKKNSFENHISQGEKNSALSPLATNHLRQNTATMRPAAATATAVATATKSISRTESLELMRCLLRVVSPGGEVEKDKEKKRRTSKSARERVFFSSSFSFHLPQSLPPPRSAAEPARDLEKTPSGATMRRKRGKRGERGRARGLSFFPFFFFSPTERTGNSKTLFQNLLLSPSSTSRTSVASSRTPSSSP